MRTVITCQFPTATAPQGPFPSAGRHRGPLLAATLLLAAALQPQHAAAAPGRPPATPPASAVAPAVAPSTTPSVGQSVAQSTTPSATRVPDTLAQRLLACAPCHGREGKASASGYQPRIAGKPAGYLFNQLKGFSEGRRSNAAMTALLDTLSEPYLREIAEHYAALDLPYPPPQTRELPAALAARGRQLVMQGDDTRGLPACTRCHGAALTGLRPAVPGLLGLPRDYISAQLGAWQTGLRRAYAPDCMAQVARQLRAEDVNALAAWLSAQTLPADAHPAAALPERLPLDCGGLGH